MEKPVYVYFFQGTEDALHQKAAAYLGTSPYFWVADIAKIDMGKGIPDQWHNQGAVFSERGELRWWKNSGWYEALLLAEDPISDSDLRPIVREWIGSEETVFLQDLNERRVAPTFTAYPLANTSGSLKVKVYRQNGVTTFVSPRGFILEE